MSGGTRCLYGSEGAAPHYRNESERCKLIMYMKSFLDTDHTTGSLWSSRKSLCLQQEEYTHNGAEKSSSSNTCCCYTDFTSATKQEWESDRTEKLWVEIAEGCSSGHLAVYDFHTDQTQLALIFPQIVSCIWQFHFQPHHPLKDRTCMWGTLWVPEAAAGTGALHTCAKSNVVCAPPCHRRWSEVLVKATGKTIRGYSFPSLLSQTHLCLKQGPGTFFSC